MPYSLPVFNLTCNIVTGPDNTDPPRVSGAACNLAYSRRVNTGGNTKNLPDDFILSFTMTLLLPAATDIRGHSSATGYDAVEVPAGSGRWYSVVAVDHVGYGFTNWHKAAVLQQWIPFKTPDT